MNTQYMAEYIDKLDTAAEDRLLTTKLVPGQISAENKTSGCIVGVATGAFSVEDLTERYKTFDSHGTNVNMVVEFNNACRADPIATAEFIRNRILENRVKKELAGVRETVGAFEAVVEEETIL